MAQESFSKTVLDTLGKIADALGEARVSELSHNLGIQTRTAHKRMLNTLSEMKNAGKVVRVRQGVYALTLREKQPELREVMWRILRMRRRVTVDDLVEMAGASVKYSRDWLRMLEGREVVRKSNQGAANNPCIWHLINDTVEMPEDTKQAEYLRERRKKIKQQALADLAAAQKLIGKAHQAITEMED